MNGLMTVALEEGMAGRPFYLCNTASAYLWVIASHCSRFCGDDICNNEDDKDPTGQRVLPPRTLEKAH